MGIKTAAREDDPDDGVSAALAIGVAGGAAGLVLLGRRRAAAAPAQRLTEAIPLGS